MGGALRLRLTGLAQGAGVRPWLKRLADRRGLSGWARNTGEGVEVWVEGDAEALEGFLEDVDRGAPAGSRPTRGEPERATAAGHVGFAIRESEAVGAGGARVPPDRAVCDACLAESSGEGGSRRAGDAFASCAGCGPRFTVIEAMPYDRERTTLRAFPLCERCVSEWNDPSDRRFHVQGMTCPDCGPRLRWTGAGEGPGGSAEGREALDRALRALRGGGVVAVKGLGGYQLAGRADLAATVDRMRALKGRDRKPFAALGARSWLGEGGWMGRWLSASERAALGSAENPIVIAEAPAERFGLAPGMAPGLGTTGLTGPSTALHEMLARGVGAPLALTSANAEGAPMAIEDDRAFREWGWRLEGILSHDRPIARRADDSVARVIGGEAATFRVGRGLAPLALPGLEVRGWGGGPSILALGGPLKSAPAFWNGALGALGAHAGDLDHPGTIEASGDSGADLARLMGGWPELVAIDAHPDFPARGLVAGRFGGARLIRVGHHHAHGAATLAEHGRLEEDSEALALTWDGTGHGSDGTVWGGEALLVNGFRGTCRRAGSLRPFPMPGGEAAIREPRRIAFGLSVEARGAEATLGDEWFLGRLGLSRERASILATMIIKGVNTPWTSSVGRLFDGVAALALGRGEAGYEGEPAMALEGAAGDWGWGDGERSAIPTRTEGGAEGVARGDWRGLWVELTRGAREGRDAGDLARRFHRSLVEWGASLAREFPGRTIALGGGCFQNRRLNEELRDRLEREGRTVLAPSRAPAGDGGLSAGQLAVARALAARGGLG